MINTRYYLLLLLLLSQTNKAQDLEHWLSAPAPQASIGARIGTDEDQQSLWGINAQIPLPYYSELTLEWFESNQDSNNDLAFDNYFLAVSTDPVATWSVAINYEYSGNDQIIEVDSITVSLQYYPGNWLFNAALIKGNVSNFIQPELRELEALSNATTTIDQHGYSLKLQYYSGPWSWQLQGQSLAYSEDLTKVTTNRRLRRIINQQTLTHIFNLVDWRIHSNVGYDWKKTSLHIGLSHFQLTVENNKASNIYSNIDYRLSNNLSLAVMLANSLNDSLLYSELSARYRW